MDSEKKHDDIESILNEMQRLRHAFALIEKSNDVSQIYGKYIAALTVAIMEGIFIAITFITAIAN